jgi:hypothetical protein
MIFSIPYGPPEFDEAIIAFLYCEAVVEFGLFFYSYLWGIAVVGHDPKKGIA